MKDWKIYKGTQNPHNEIENLPKVPPWRDFSKSKSHTHGRTFCLSNIEDGKEIKIVNAALILRRPLLVTGPPGSGKSSLAYAVAYELGLGKVLRWPVNSRSTLYEGLYSYDAVARLRDITYEQHRMEIEGRTSIKDHAAEDIGAYITLGPLGTAIFPKGEKPRVLLIDEIDKGDIDLPNDLLHIFEEGEFRIDELVRVASRQKTVRIMPYDGENEDDKVEISEGKVKCRNFPFVVMTSNGERDFPPAFLRRCLHLDIDPPDENQLRRIIDAHLDHYDSDEMENILRAFSEKRGESGVMATDQLLNAVYLLASGRGIGKNEQNQLEKMILKELGRK